MYPKKDLMVVDMRTPDATRFTFMYISTSATVTPEVADDAEKSAPSKLFLYDMQKKCVVLDMENDIIHTGMTDPLGPANSDYVVFSGDGERRILFECWSSMATLLTLLNEIFFSRLDTTTKTAEGIDLLCDILEEEGCEVLRNRGVSPQNLLKYNLPPQKSLTRADVIPIRLDRLVRKVAEKDIKGAKKGKGMLEFINLSDVIYSTDYREFAGMVLNLDMLLPDDIVSGVVDGNGVMCFNQIEGGNTCIADIQQVLGLFPDDIRINQIPMIG
jgi:hypothetical protein